MAYRWQEITESLRAAIGAGQYPRGSRLPTEAELADSFAVNRHTVRRAGLWSRGAPSAIAVVRLAKLS